MRALSTRSRAVHGAEVHRLRSVLERSDEGIFAGTVGDTAADIESAFSIMLRCTRGGIVRGTDNATYAAARLEASRAWVPVDDAIESLRSGR